MFASTKIRIACSPSSPEAAWRPAYVWTTGCRYEHSRALARIAPAARRSFIDTHVAIQVIAQITTPQACEDSTSHYEPHAMRTGAVYSFRT